VSRAEAEELREEFRLKVIEATRDSIRRDDEIHTLIAERTRAATAERKREGMIFALGIFLALIRTGLTFC
jgi:hypothetical protein